MAASRAVQITLLVTWLLLAGCGPLDRAELGRGVETLGAITAEGQLLAAGVAADRTRSTFARVHAATLADDASHEAEKLADAHVETGADRERDQAVGLAQRIDDALGELETFPGGERTGAQVRAELAAIADDIERLSERIKAGT